VAGLVLHTVARRFQELDLRLEALSDGGRDDGQP
jgi:hypothetical protein